MNKENITYLTDAALITCVVKTGLSDVILKAARDVGVLTGAVSYHARGHGARERFGLLSIAVEAEKEVVSIVVSLEQQEAVCRSICQAGNLDAPGNGYLYITPLEKIATYVPQDMLSKPEEES